MFGMPGGEQQQGTHDDAINPLLQKFCGRFVNRRTGQLEKADLDNCVGQARGDIAGRLEVLGDPLFVARPVADE